jgi:hypothetical protein
MTNITVLHDGYAILVHPRIAQALGLRKGQKVDEKTMLEVIRLNAELFLATPPQRKIETDSENTAKQ